MEMQSLYLLVPLAPLVGAALAGLSYAAITGERITAQVEGMVRTEEPSV